MDRRLFLHLSASALLSNLLPAASSQPVPLDLDSYAIWSRLIPRLRPDAKAYLVPATTAVPGIVDQLNGWDANASLTPMQRAMTQKAGSRWVKVPPGSQPAFREAAAAFSADLHQPAQVNAELHLPHAYRIMNKEAMAEYGRLEPPLCVAGPEPWHRDRRLEHKYAGYAPPCLFSRVFFDRERTLGLVWACTAEGSETIFTFGKAAGAWTELQWPADSWSVNC